MVVRVRRVTASADLTVGRTVDWGFAATVGQWLARPGPPSTDYTRRQVVENLATAAKAAEPPVREVTGLHTDGAVPEARIVDRPGWIRAAAESMRAMTGGTDKPRGAISGRVTGAQTGAVLAFVSSGILGQYDPFSDGGALLLVYPNVIAVERQLRLEPSDFRLWVCLHEVTHRVQFTANPWLSGYMSQALGVLTQEGSDDVAQVVSRLADFARGRRRLRTRRPELDGHPRVAARRAVRPATRSAGSAAGARHAVGGPCRPCDGCRWARCGSVGVHYPVPLRRATATASSRRCNGCCARCWASTPN